MSLFWDLLERVSSRGITYRLLQLGSQSTWPVKSGDIRQRYGCISGNGDKSVS